MGKKEKREVYDVFKDVWRGGQWTVSNDRGYTTVPTMEEAVKYAEDYKIGKVV